MGLTGDFHELANWARQIDSIGSGDTLSTVSRLFATETLERIDEQFEQQRDPFGKSWAPHKKPTGRKIGHGKTGRMRSTYRVKRSTRFGFTVGSDTEYRRWFHGGKKGQKPRPLSPGNRLPPRWDAGYDTIWNGYCLTKLGRRGGLTF